MRRCMNVRCRRRRPAVGAAGAACDIKVGEDGDVSVDVASGQSQRRVDAHLHAGQGRAARNHQRQRRDRGRPGDRLAGRGPGQTRGRGRAPTRRPQAAPRRSSRCSRTSAPDRVTIEAEGQRRRASASGRTAGAASSTGCRVPAGLDASFRTENGGRPSRERRRPHHRRRPPTAAIVGRGRLGVGRCARRSTAASQIGPDGGDAATSTIDDGQRPASR